MKKYIFCLISIMLLPILVMSQDEVSAEYIYYADPSQSLKEAKAAAIESARIAALGNKYGTLITQDILSQMNNKDSYFSLLSSIEVKGEWIEDLITPETKIVEILENDVQVIKAKVKGLARPISNSAADFEVLALRNGIDHQRFCDTNFKEGDKLYLYFKSPVDGYMAAYLIDEKQQVFCLLPQENSSDGQQKVIHNKEYVFFSEKLDADFKYQDGMRVTCESEGVELNRIYVMFSPNPFVKPIDQEGGTVGDKHLVLPRQLSMKEFSRWMNNVYARDKKMGRKVIRLKIIK